MKLDKYWYVFLVPIIGFSFFAATMFLISGITNGDADVGEAIKLYIVTLVLFLFLYIPYKINTPSKKQMAIAKSKYEAAIAGFDIPETAKTIVISNCDELLIKEKCVQVWRGAKSLHILTADKEPQLFEYPLEDFSILSRCENTYTKAEIKTLEEEWNKHNIYVKAEFGIFRREIKKGKGLTYKLGGIEMSSHSCYVLLSLLKADLANIDFGEGDRKEILEQYYNDGAIPHYIYTREKVRLE